jgi:hypothetical protein
MRNNHLSYRLIEGTGPTPAELARYVVQARRMRSVAMYEYLVGAAAWVRRALRRPAREAKDPVGQCC